MVEKRVKLDQVPWRTALDIQRWRPRHRKRTLTQLVITDLQHLFRGRQRACLYMEPALMSRRRRICVSGSSSALRAIRSPISAPPLYTRAPSLLHTNLLWVWPIDSKSVSQSPSRLEGHNLPLRISIRHSPESPACGHARRGFLG